MSKGRSIFSIFKYFSSKRQSSQYGMNETLKLLFQFKEVPSNGVSMKENLKNYPIHIDMGQLSSTFFEAISRFIAWGYKFSSPTKSKLSK